MKKILSILFVTCFSLAGFSQNKGYQIKIKIKDIQDTTCYLISYFGNQRYYKDTATFDKNDVAIFSGKKQIEGGIYSVYVGGKVLFEIVIDEPIIELSTDTSNYIKNMVIKKSAENQLFLDHILFAGEKQQKAQKLRTEYADENLKEKRKKAIEKELNGIDKEVKAYQQNIIKEHPKSFVANIFHAMIEPETPEFNEEKNDSIKKALRYHYYKNHFFDHIDFTDARINRTPIYHNKLEKYFKSVVYPHPDSIIVDVDKIITRAKANDDLYKYTVHYLINKYERSKIMGMDAVFAHIALKYYTHELAFWVDADQIDKVQERARKLSPLLIGKPAINISLLDTASKNWMSLYDIKTDYTVLIFWDPECGHCKKELPEILEYYHSVKDKGVSVYAVSSDHNDAWKKFVKDNNMDFINVAIPQDVYKDNQKASEYIRAGYTDLQSLNYKDTYDIFSTPQIYLLDKDKKFIAKKLDVNLLKQVLEREWEINGK